MTDPRVKSLANILVNYSTNVKHGDWVLIPSSIEAMPLTLEVFRSVIEAGGNPDVILGSDDLNEVKFSVSSDEQLKWISPLKDIAYKKADVLINLRGTSNTRSLSGIDPKKQQISQIAHRELTQMFFKRAAEGKCRWTLTQYPCPAYAQEADMSLSEFEDFVYAATFADQADPIKCWKDIHNEQQRLVDWLAGKNEVIVKGPNADLTLSIQDRVFINSDGKKNMPSGEIFTGPVEDSVEGWIRFTYPAIRRGREVIGVELEFEQGKVVSARAEKNENFLITMLDSDEGSRYVGEFAIGTNYGIKQFTKSILFDEKIGGSIHLAIGHGIIETGSKNESSIHWDFICDMRDDSQIMVDGELFYKNGEFQV